MGDLCCPLALNEGRVLRWKNETLIPDASALKTVRPELKNSNSGLHSNQKYFGNGIGIYNGEYG
jgi:hypothetical protein